LYISNYLKLGAKGHFTRDFVDVFLNGDNRLFIDPSLIERGNDTWCKSATNIMNSFFDVLFSTIRSGGSTDILFAHAGEQNATKLGYGSNGRNGKGKTAKGLKDCLRGLYPLVQEISTVSRPQDIPVFVPGFAEDCMSDLLTNILHGHINDFTAEQMKKYGRKPDSENVFFTWDMAIKEWVKVSRPCWLHNNKELLLVPKHIVRKNFLFNTGQYLRRVILERVREENNWQDMSKKDIEANISRDKENWSYDYIVDYTKQQPEALCEYHKKLPSYYNEVGGAMTDAELDDAVYGENTQ